MVIRIARTKHRHALAILGQVRQEKGNANQATLAVARKLVAYLLAVDRSRQPFRMPALEGEAATAASTS